jgi:hypothetical protein
MIRSSKPASTVVPAFRSVPFNDAATSFRALTFTFNPNSTSRRLSRLLDFSSRTSSFEFTATKTCGSDTFFFALK